MITEENRRLVQAKLEHDIRSNLNVVLGYGAMLQEDIAEREVPDVLEDVNCMIAASRELLLLNSQAEDLNRIAVGRWKESRTSASLVEMFRKICDERQAELSGCDVTVDGDPDSFTTVDINAVGKLFASLVILIAKLAPGEALRVAVDSQSGEFSVGCDSENWESARAERFKQQLSRLTASVHSMMDIKDFDSYYLTTMSACARTQLTSMCSGVVCTPDEAGGQSTAVSEDISPT